MTSTTSTQGSCQQTRTYGGTSYQVCTNFYEAGAFINTISTCPSPTSLPDCAVIRNSLNVAIVSIPYIIYRLATRCISLLLAVFHWCSEFSTGFDGRSLHHGRIDFANVGIRERNLRDIEPFGYDLGKNLLDNESYIIDDNFLGLLKNLATVEFWVGAGQAPKFLRH